VNPAQKRCQLSAISLINLDNVKSQEVENAGFATYNATNAGRSLESSRRKRAEGVLQAVKTRLDATVSAFLAGGKVAPTLQADLTKAGMYGLVVDVVDTAFEQASEHASWNQEGVNHREILAAKLEEALSAKQDLFKEAASSSDDKVLFFKLLDQQLNFLAPYMPTGWAVTGGATVRQALPALPLQP
jgi:hypothetical protein